MAAPVLLVNDDIASIASVRRLLAREGYEVILATSAADAIIAFGHYLPGLVILSPGVEGGRGQVVLEELSQHPDRQLCRVLLLGESVPGFAAPVVPLPLDGKHFLDTVAEVMRDSGNADQWTVVDDNVRRATEEIPALAPQEEAWRATSPGASKEGLEETLFKDLPPPAEPEPWQATTEETAIEPVTDPGAAAVPTVDWAAAPSREQLDAQLDEFEREVLEAARARRRQREAKKAKEEVSREIEALEPEADLGSPPEKNWFEEEAPNRPEEDFSSLNEPEAPAERTALYDVSALREQSAPTAEHDIPAVEGEGQAGAEWDSPAGTYDLSAEEAEPATGAWDLSTVESELATGGEGANLAAESDQTADPTAQEEDQPDPFAEAGAASGDPEASELTSAPSEQQDLAAATDELPDESTELASEPNDQPDLSAATYDLPDEGGDLASESNEPSGATYELPDESGDLASESNEPSAATYELPDEPDDLTSESLDQPDLAAATDESADLAAPGDDVPEAEADLASPIDDLPEAEADLAPPGDDIPEAEADLAATDLTAPTDPHLDEEAQRAAEAEEIRLEDERRASARADLERLEAEYQARLSEEAARREAAEARAQREEEERKQLRSRLEEEARLRLDAEERAAKEAEAQRELEARLAEEAARREEIESILAERERALEEAVAREDELRERQRQTSSEASEAERVAREVRESTEQRARELEEETERTLATLRAEVEKSSELARLEREERQALAQRLAELRQQSDQAETRAEEAVRAAEAERLQLEDEQRAREAAEEAARRAREEAEALADLARRPLELPGREPVRLPPAGVVTLEELARIVLRLAEVRAEVRLDLRVDDALRTLWFQRGQIVGAASTLPQESLLDRARRDGLIDARQDAEVRLLRGMLPAELLQRLRARGYLREHEVVPLVQRYTELVALEALSEPRSEYRLGEEPLPPGIPLAAAPRAPAQLALEALRRSLDGVERLGAMGGLAALPSWREGAEPDLNALGLSEKERRLLNRLDGETSIEVLLLGAGMRQEAALKLIAAGVALGWLEVLRPEVPADAPLALELDLARLDAKLREVQESDYFTLLGLPRTAGDEEVRRACDLLAQEFDPLKYVGHPDVSLQHRARQVQEAVQEAAFILQDDRLRQSYARSLVD